MNLAINNFKQIFIEIVSTLLILLFVYAAISKILDFENFQAQLSQSPLLSAYTGLISYTLIIIELTISFCLAVPKFRAIGLISSFTLMVMFTSYIVVIINYSSFVPCSCGGILEKLGWHEHLIFNIIFTLLAGFAAIIDSKYTSLISLKLLIITVTSVGFIAALYFYSEKEMHQENPFIRRFIQGASFKIETAELGNNSKYYAGNDGTTIYFADSKAPLHITAYDTLLKVQQRFKIKLERENFPFTSVQIKIAAPYFYIFDGTVPVIYKGLLADWNARLIMYDTNYYFSLAEILAPDKIVFRAQKIKSLNNILGTFTFKDSVNVNYIPQLLQKQIDGYFDTDGMLLFDNKSKKIIYTYYYRNQFIVADNNGKLIFRGNTIDTTTLAKLNIVKIPKTGQRKIASIPNTVNQLTAVSNNLLFVNSQIIGKYEPKEMWKEAAIIDIYDIKKNKYLSSIYIYNINKEKVRQIFVIDHYLYAIIGHQVHKYELSKKHFIND